jgi:hypothetical protein
MCADKTLTVHVTDDLAEISVLNSNFDRVARSVGGLEESLPAGIYKVVVRVGPVVTDQLVSLDQDRQLSIAAPDIPSPIPLETSSHGHDYQRAAAIRVSTARGDIFGEGASLFIFVRETATDGPRDNPAAGLSLLDENGAVLRKIADRADVNVDRAPWAGWRADVSPGAYRVRLELPNHRAFERALVATRGKQTQLFMVPRDYGLPNIEAHRAADLAGGTVAVSLSDGFYPQDHRARLTELASYALMQTRHILSDALLKRLLDEKFDEPMLGLLGAHLMLRDHPGDARLFEIVTDNLRKLLGEDHPDVQALWLRRSNRGNMKEIRVKTPPMLRRSWELATEESVRDKDVIPSQAPSGTIALKVLPATPWLVWRGEAAEESALEGLAHDLPAATGALADYLKTRVRHHAGRLPQLGVMQRVTRGVRSLPLVRRVVGAPETEVASETSPELTLSEKTEIARVLGVPGNAIDEVVKRFSR